MSESLTSRVGRLIAGSFHAFVERVENAAPETVMEQAIREIDAAIDQTRADLGQVEAQRHLSARRLAEDSARLEQLDEQARLALLQGREDLAAAAVERQIDLEAQLVVLEARLTELAEDKSRLEGYLSALQAKRRELRQALDDCRAARAAATEEQGGSAATNAVATTRTGNERVDQAADVFERLFQRQTGLQAASGTRDEQAARLAELDELARQHRITERLARLKADN